ncbi:hypothetical protein Q8A64_03360 [Oxalobacteraceae bacterium R-40]|uniref:Uncharacterized protein n=1 Tax=Keguizhuia sedimenti TaxID=3064264 RepID=A0ABU1BKC4_9BURK|nr:hypothetical protein [Oxalobacteraceae bacterium R-40]
MPRVLPASLSLVPIHALGSKPFSLYALSLSLVNGLTVTVEDCRACSEPAFDPNI